MVGNSSTLMVISSVLGVQVPLVMVHLKVLIPVVNPVTPELGSFTLVTLAVPAMTVHVPVPISGVLADKVAVGEQIV